MVEPGMNSHGQESKYEYHAKRASPDCYNGPSCCSYSQGRHMKLRAAVYLRVSTDMQLDNFSLEAQREVCLRLIESRGWVLTSIYSDEGLSARTTERKAFQEMLEAAKSKLFDVIVVHKLDRFSRSVTDLLLTLRELEQVGVSVVSATEEFDFSTPIGKVLLTLLAAFAQWYVDNLSAEIKKGQKARAMAGHWNSVVPFGYDAAFKRHGGDGLAMVNEHEAEGVRLAFRLSSEGKSDREVVDALNKAGYRSIKGRLFGREAVIRILTGRFYLGEVQYRGEWYPGLHEPIISQELFDQVQEARRLRRTAPGGKRRKRGRVYLLTTFARCAKCGAFLKGTQGGRAGRPERTFYYACIGKERFSTCDAKLIPAKQLDAMFAERVAALQIVPNWRELALEQARELLGQDQQKDVERERARLEGRLERLTELRLEGDISRERFKAESEKIKAELAALQPPQALPNLEQAAAVLADFRTFWEKATPEERREVAQLLAESVTAERTEDGIKLEIVWRQEFSTFFVSSGGC